MLVSNWMSKRPVTIDANDSMQAAITLMKQHGIRMLPVVKKGKLVGVVTDRDLKSSSICVITFCGESIDRLGLDDFVVSK